MLSATIAVMLTIHGQFTPWEITRMPPPEMGAMIKVNQGETVQISPTWDKNCANENALVIFEHPSGRIVRAWNNFVGPNAFFGPKGAIFTLPSNHGTEPVFYLVVPLAKHAPNPKLDWHTIPFVIMDSTEKTVVIATSDLGNERRMTSGRVTIRSSK